MCFKIQGAAKNTKSVLITTLSAVKHGATSVVTELSPVTGETIEEIHCEHHIREKVSRATTDSASHFLQAFG